MSSLSCLKAWYGREGYGRGMMVLLCFLLSFETCVYLYQVFTRLDCNYDLQTFLLSTFSDMLTSLQAVVFIGMLFGLVLRISHQDYENLVTLDPQLFFLFILPPIIFESAYLGVNKGDFFRHIVPIVVFALIGTVISAVIIRWVLPFWLLPFPPQCNLFWLGVLHGLYWIPFNNWYFRSLADLWFVQFVPLRRRRNGNSLQDAFLGLLHLRLYGGGIG